MPMRGVPRDRIGTHEGRCALWVLDIILHPDLHLLTIDVQPLPRFAPTSRRIPRATRSRAAVADLAGVGVQDREVNPLQRRSDSTLRPR